MKKFCLVLAYDWDFRPPLFFNTCEEAHEAMSDELRTQMEKHLCDGWTTDSDEWVESIRNSEDVGIFGTKRYAMWWIGDNRRGDYAIFEIDIFGNDWKANTVQEIGDSSETWVINTKKFCLVLAQDLEFNPPLFFNTYGEAYEAMKCELRTQMEEKNRFDGWMDAKNDAEYERWLKSGDNNEKPGLYELNNYAMWWGIGDYRGEGEIFEINVSGNDWKAKAVREISGNSETEEV